MQLAPTSGSTFQSTTLSQVDIVRTSAGGPIDLGSFLNSDNTPLFVSSTLTQSGPLLAQWDFTLFLDPAVFDVTQTYYLQGSVDIVFSNTGQLSRRETVQFRHNVVSHFSAPFSELGPFVGSGLAKERYDLLLRHEAMTRQSNSTASGNSLKSGAASNIFSLRSEIAATTSPQLVVQPSPGVSVALIAGVAGGIGGVVAALAVVITVVVVRKKRRLAKASDSPLQAINLDGKEAAPNDFDNV